MTNSFNNNIPPFGDTKLTTILKKICEGVEVPNAKELSVEDSEHPIELIEIRNYPLPPITCPHLEEKGIGEDCVECQHKQYAIYKQRYVDFVKENGLEHTHTLKAAFDYYSNLITQYRLTEGDELLDQVYPFCITRPKSSSFHILAIQSRAFLRFKQGKYQEALEYFEKQLDILGPNDTIYENMALVYSRLGQKKEAAIAYARAILLILKNPQEKQRFATLLMGLSNVLDNTDDALTVLETSLQLLKERFDKPHSLMAKALGAMGDLYMKKKDYNAAEKCFNEAVNIFISTCGYDTPLTSNAMNKYANVLLMMGSSEKAQQTYLESLKVWSQVDNHSFDANGVAEALINLSKGIQANALQKTSLKKNILIIESIQKKITDNSILADDINSLCLLKFIYEIYIILGDISRAKTCCIAFKNDLEKLDTAQLGSYISYRDKLLEETKQILTLLESIQ